MTCNCCVSLSCTGGGSLKKVVVLKECSEGNEHVGSMWIESAIFEQSSTLEEVLQHFTPYGGDDISKATKYGKLIITVANDE